jgi:Restriction endonuclease
MPDTSSTTFEQMIARIHALFEAAGTKITWNDRVYGKADPERERQVDITIQRAEGLVHVECRMHSRPQDVGWIEQLMGRRITLGADSLIAVSSSGFTEGAKRTASANGVVLRDMLALTEQEILAWGRKVDIFVRYLRYETPELYFIYDQAVEGLISTEESVAQAPISLILADILNKSVSVVRKVDLKVGKSANALINLEPSSITVKSYPLLMAVFCAKVTCFEETGRVAKVQVYGDPAIPAEARDVYVQTFESTNVQVSRMADRSYLYLDFSSIVPPDDAQFYDVILDMKQPGRLMGMELLAHKVPQVHFAALKAQNLFGDPQTVLRRFLSEHPNYAHVD